MFEIRKEEYFNKGLMKDAKEVEEAQDMAIEALSSAEADWIPCEIEGLPPEGEEVLVSDGKHIWIDESVAGDATEEGYMMWWDNGSDWTDTAWMPLPEPYKGAVK